MFSQIAPGRPYTRGATWGRLFTAEGRHIGCSYNDTPLFIVCPESNVCSLQKISALIAAYSYAAIHKELLRSPAASYQSNTD